MLISEIILTIIGNRYWGLSRQACKDFTCDDSVNSHSIYKTGKRQREGTCSGTQDWE